MTRLGKYFQLLLEKPFNVSIICNNSGLIIANSWYYMHHRSQLDTEIFNDGTKDGDVLNSGCGADFVKVNLYIQKNLDIESDFCSTYIYYL